MPENSSAIKHVFSDRFYQEMNEDVTSKGMDPFEHYVTHGYREGRKPSNIIDIEYFIKTRLPSTTKELSLDELSDMLDGVDWSDDFSFHHLLCPSWIGLQLSELCEVHSFVDALAVPLDTDQISLHPGLKAISCSVGETLGDVLNGLHDADVGALSIIDLERYRSEHRDVKNSDFNDIQCLAHLWSEGIFENRLKYLGCSAPKWATKSEILKINCIVALRSEGQTRFKKQESKYARLPLDSAKFDFCFDVEHDFLKHQINRELASLSWIHIHDVHVAVSRGKSIIYTSSSSSIDLKSRAIADSGRKEIRDIDLLNGSAQITHSKRVCYSINLDGYDDFPLPPDLDDCQYFLVTDAVDLPQDDRWVIVRPTLLERDKKRLCLWYKTHPHKLFSWHPYCNWIDSNIRCLNGSEHVLYAHEAISEIATFAHPDRSCVYKEAEELKRLSLDFPETIDRVVKQLKDEGMPQNHGLFETNVLFANLNDVVVRQFFDEWWRRVNSGSRRDQMGFSPAAWKTGVYVSPLDGAGMSSAKNNKFFKKIPHTNDSGRKVK